MKTFKYYDNKQGHKIIFEVKAETISEADEKINKELGIKVEKIAHISCTISNLDKLIPCKNIPFFTLIAGKNLNGPV